MIDETHVAVPEDRGLRVRLALDAALDALRLAQREAEGAMTDRARLKWAALGMVSALQGALVAALSGYDTAHIDAVLNPSHSGQLAPVALLLRRARSEDYLNAPERVELTGQVQRALDRVLKVRNAAVHALDADLPGTVCADLAVAAGLIAHLVWEHPAFEVASVRVQAAFLRDALTEIARTLEALPPA